MYPSITAPGMAQHDSNASSYSAPSPYAVPQQPYQYPSNGMQQHAQQQAYPSLPQQAINQQQPYNQQPYSNLSASPHQNAAYPYPLQTAQPQQQQQQQQQQAYPSPHVLQQQQQHHHFRMQEQHQPGGAYPSLPQQQYNSTTPLYPQLQQQQQPYNSTVPLQLQQQQQQPGYPQQQQQQQQLPAYPTVPQPLPYSAPPETVHHGYDVMIYIVQAKNLPGMDWWNGRADPYCQITTVVPGPTQQQIVYKTKTVHKNLNPTWDEFFELGNLPPGSCLLVEVWDKDLVTEDDIIGRANWAFAPKELLPSSTAGGGMLAGDASWGRLLVQLQLNHPTKKPSARKQGMGTVELEVCYRPSTKPGPAAMMGPVRFKQHLNPTAGIFTGHWANDATMCFSTYKLYLMHIDSTFGDVKMPWNRDYDKAVHIFKSPLMLSTVRTQHSSLYASNMGASRVGVLTSTQEFFELFKCGMRGGQRRYFTYCLMPDSFRCSETGAAFFNDMMSKHAMHSGGEEEVLYAGEFCIVPDAAAAGGYRLVIDNNSGTYAPDGKALHLMQQLFKANFPDMCVDVLAVGDPKLKYYQQQCPSRAAA